jgi:hypothetical protein
MIFAVGRKGKQVDDLIKCCSNCQYNLKLIKYDYSNGGCQHSDYDGYACMAFASEGTAVHLIGTNPENEYCECWMPKKKGEESW